MDVDQNMNETHAMKFLDNLTNPLDNPSPSDFKKEKKIVPTLQLKELKQVGSPSDDYINSKSACGDTDEQIGKQTNQPKATPL